MRITRAQSFRAERAWGASDIANIEGASVRLHWTNEPYHWHVNDGQEVFAVLLGQVEMFYREADQEKSVLLGPGDVFFADKGEQHKAVPIGEARILVIERQGSE